jgi:hypothetical protein
LVDDGTGLPTTGPGGVVIELKDETISLRGCSSELLFGLYVVDQVVSDLSNGATPTVVTSGSESWAKHGQTSLHYTGDAVDIRTKTLRHYAQGNPPLPNVTDLRDELVREVRRRLGPDWDFFVESVDTPNEHAHLEFQPRRRDAAGRVV